MLTTGHVPELCQQASLCMSQSNGLAILLKGSGALTVGMSHLFTMDVVMAISAWGAGQPQEPGPPSEEARRWPLELGERELTWK